MSELSEIFDLDPLSLTKDDERLKKAIEGYRAMAYKFNLDGTTATKKVAAPKSAKARSVAALMDESGDLGIKI